MFGMTMIIKSDRIAIKLRACTKNDLPVLVHHFSSMKIHMYTKGLFAQTLENETEWYDKTRQSKDVVSWLIVPEMSGDNNIPIGVTALHGIDSRENACSSGIIIWDDQWWGKGVASAAHLGRTLFAADYLNRYKINSCVRVANVASRCALERVGYTIWGTEPIVTRRAGEWLDTHHLSWIHPELTDHLFPSGVPKIYISGLEKATTALSLARKTVEFP